MNRTPYQVSMENELEKVMDFKLPAPAWREGNQLMSLASLFQGAFSLDWITYLTGQRARPVLSLLEEAVGQNLLVRQQVGVYAFKDPKIQKQWEERLSESEKEILYRRIAELLLKELPDDQDKAQAVAFYLLRIPNDLERCKWLVKAGDISRKASRFEDALLYYSKALQDISSLTEQEESDPLFIDAAIQYSKVSMAREDTDRVLSIIQEAIRRAKRSDRQQELPLLHMHLAKNEWLQSRYASAQRLFQEGWSMIKDMDDPKLLLSATTFRIFFLYWQGRLCEAVNVYENSVSDIDKYPHSTFPILAGGLVGHCYAQIGQITQGLGMLDALRKHCSEKSMHFLAADAEINMASTLVDLRRVDEAFSYLENSVQKAGKDPNNWNQIRANSLLSFVYFLKGEREASFHYLKVWLRQSRELKIAVRLHPYQFEICKAGEEGKIPRVEDFSLEKEVRHCIEWDNILMKGVAYRYQAFLHEKGNLPSESIIKSLNLSVKWLEESGQKFELCRTYLELMRQYSLMGREQEADGIKQKTSAILISFGEAFVPEDLKFLLNQSPPREGQNLIGEILKLGQEIVTIRNHKDLIQNILSTVNRITGAERMALFILEENPHGFSLSLKASKNITSEQVEHPSFGASRKMMEEVAATGKGRILRMGSPEGPSLLSRDQIRSRICVPMIMRGKTVGVLYSDNSLFSSPFKESDLDLISYFAAQAAIALDNAKAYEEIRHLNQRLNEEKQYYAEQHLQNLHFEDIVGEGPAIKQVLTKIEQVAKTETTVLILGETGVGKELVARAIHRHSSRRDKSFIKLFCSALPESLIPSELFGHEKGASTGADRRRIGRFELADGGTLFLDEIGDLPLDIQTRLLQVLQSKEFERVGGSETIRSDFRLVAATNRDLETEIKAGNFRSDLYYRLNVFPIFVPPLRERREDIPLLAYYFLKIYATKMGKTFEGIPKGEMEKLMHYPWPGNVRELENILERGTILSSGPYFRAPELSLEPLEFGSPKIDFSLQENERFHILRALQKTGWKVRGSGGAAELLKIHPSTLNFRMKKLGIRRTSKAMRT